MPPPKTAPTIGPSKLISIVRESYRHTDRFYTALAAEGRAQGIAIACRAGCSACCAYIVHVTTAEAHAVAEAVQHLPGPTRQAIVNRLAAWERRWSSHAAEHGGDRLGAGPATVVAWQARQIGCPMLDLVLQTCLVYGDRPIACRVHHAAQVNREAEPLCPTCPNLDAPAACRTTEAHVACGHAPWVWQLRNDLIQVCGGLTIMALQQRGATDAQIQPDVLPLLVLDLGRHRYGWRSTIVVELPMVRPLEGHDDPQ